MNELFKDYPITHTEHDQRVFGNIAAEIREAFIHRTEENIWMMAG